MPEGNAQTATAGAGDRRMRQALVVRLLIAAGVFCLCILLQRGTGVASQPYRDALYVAFAIAGLFTVVNTVILTLRHDVEFSPRFIRYQLLLDLVLVAAIVNFTGGIYSLLSFLYIIVVLEAGILLSQFDSIIAATLASAALFVNAVLSYYGVSGAAGLGMSGAAARLGFDSVTAYRFVVQVFAFYLTGFISGYWSWRVRRLLAFQRGLLNHLNSGFLIVGEDGKVTTLNVAGLGILGYDAEEAVGRPCAEVFNVVGDSENPLELALTGGKEFTSHEFEVTRKDGKKIPVGLSTSLITDRAGHITGVVGSFADIGDLVRIRHELRQQDRLAAVGELAAGLAHEIRNPLAAIRGSVQELESNLGNQDVAGALVSIATREADQLNEIVSGFLDFAGYHPNRKERFEVNELLAEVVELLERDPKTPDTVAIESVSGAPPCEIEADRSQIKQTMLNIGKNAVEAMPGGGKLVIEDAFDSEQKFVSISFVDQGEGIAPENLDTVFEPFYSSKADGVGMGLAVVHKIITAHGGNVKIESQQGVGTVVVVTLPIPQRDEARVVAAHAHG